MTMLIMVSNFLYCKSEFHIAIKPNCQLHLYTDTVSSLQRVLIMCWCCRKTMAIGIRSWRWDRNGCL